MLKIKTVLTIVLSLLILLFSTSCHAGYGNESDELINPPEVSSQSSVM